MVPAAVISAKYKSKRDIYYLLTVDASAYLPHHDHCTVYWLKDLVSGQKRCEYSFY
jgi:hypothetical protein